MWAALAKISCARNTNSQPVFSDVSFTDYKNCTRFFKHDIYMHQMINNLPERQHQLLSLILIKTPKISNWPLNWVQQLIGLTDWYRWRYNAYMHIYIYIENRFQLVILWPTSGCRCENDVDLMWIWCKIYCLVVQMFYSPFRVWYESKGRERVVVEMMQMRGLI